MKIFRSFSVRLTLYVFLTVATIFVCTLVYFYQMSCDEVREEAEGNAHTVLLKTVDELDNTLNTIQSISDHAVWLIPHIVDEPNSIVELTSKPVRNNPLIASCTIAFEPGYFPDMPYFAPHSFRMGDSIVTCPPNEKDTRYTEEEWYRQPMKLRQDYWGEPFYDKANGERFMVTYSHPMTDRKGHIYGIFAANIELKELERFIHNMNPYKRSHSMILDRKGFYVVRPNNLTVEKRNIFSSAINKKNEKLTELGNSMAKGEDSQMMISGMGEDYHIFFAPVKRIGWSVAVGSREQDIYQGVYEMGKVFILMALVGLLLLVSICYLVIRRTTAPLVHLTQSAQKIAAGNFTAPLPKVHSQDEMGTLCQSFGFMQQSLVKYIEDLKETTIARERIESDLRIAGEIQDGMLPKTFPTYPECQEIDLYAKLIPAKAVGGDIYQLLRMGDSLYFMLGDVSGKGVPAALIMSALCRMFRMVAYTLHSPHEIVSAINSSLADNNEKGMFCTAFFGILNLKSGQLTYCNAGHNAPVVMTAEGKAEMLEVKPNLPLGVFEDFPYEEQTLQLQPGNSLLLYTDGVTEAENNDHQLYSDEKLLATSQQLAKLTSHEVVERLYTSVQQHADGAEQSDDIAILCINYQPQAKKVYGDENHTEE